MASWSYLEWAPPISHPINVGDQVTPICTPCLSLVGAAKHRGCYPPGFGFGAC